MQERRKKVDYVRGVTPSDGLGTVTVKLDPLFSSEATVMVAPMTWARPWAMARPIPMSRGFENHREWR